MITEGSASPTGPDRLLRYVEPRLVVLGSVAKLTQQGKTGQFADGVNQRKRNP